MPGHNESEDRVRNNAAVIATTLGDGTGAIPGTAHLVTVTSDDANKRIALSEAKVGHEIWILIGGTDCELVSNVAAHKVNNVVVGVTNEAVMTATNLYHCIYVAANTWIVRGFTNLGADQAALVPD